MQIIIIKLMWKEFKMQREIAHLSEEDYKKLFPEQYYQKYAQHLNILKFESKIFKEPLSAQQPQLTKPKISSLINLNHRPSKIVLNKFDDISDTIAKNKIQTHRMQKIVRELNHKIKQGPTKNGQTIRTPLAGYGNMNEQILDKMRLIQNQQYAIQLKRARQTKRQQIQYVKFNYRNPSNSSSKITIKMDQSIIADSAQSRSINDYVKEKQLSNTMQLHPISLEAEQQQKNKQISRSLTYQQRLQKLMTDARSSVVAINPEDKNKQVKYIMALNKSIKKINTLKDNMMTQRRRKTIDSWQQQKPQKNQISTDRQEKQERGRKNLIEMTENIRKQGEQIEVLSRYKQLLKQRQLKDFLQIEEDKS